jgi:magnesium transporter
VIAAALILSMCGAGLAGMLIPLALQRAGYDPAVASAVFVTTATDVLSFFSFLGFATWWFRLG